MVKGIQNICSLVISLFPPVSIFLGTLHYCIVAVTNVFSDDEI